MIRKAKYSALELGLTFLIALIAVYVISPFELLYIHIYWWHSFLFASSVTITSFLLKWFVKNNNLLFLVFIDEVSFVIAGLVFIILATNFDHIVLYLLTFFMMPLPLIALRAVLHIQSQIVKGSFHKKAEKTIESNLNLFELINESGKLVISIPGNKIICFEANDNYVITYFLDQNNELKKSMDRASLKMIENQVLASKLSFIRVHKSFLINPMYVERILGRSQSYKLKLHFIQEPVSVSRSFDISQIKAQPVVSNL